MLDRTLKVARSLRLDHNSLIKLQTKVCTTRIRIFLEILLPDSFCSDNSKNKTSELNRIMKQVNDEQIHNLQQQQHHEFLQVRLEDEERKIQMTLTYSGNTEKQSLVKYNHIKKP